MDSPVTLSRRRANRFPDKGERPITLNRQRFRHGTDGPDTAGSRSRRPSHPKPAQSSVAAPWVSLSPAADPMGWQQVVRGLLPPSGSKGDEEDSEDDSKKGIRRGRAAGRRQQEGDLPGPVRDAGRV